MEFEEITKPALKLSDDGTAKLADPLLFNWDLKTLDEIEKDWRYKYEYTTNEVSSELK